MLVVVMSDEQVPFQDDRAIAVVHKYIRDVQPDVIIHNGDLLDFPGLTTKFARKQANRGTLRSELDTAIGILKTERLYAPKAKIIVLEGNHEDRVRVLVEERADGLEPLLAGELSLARLLTAAELGVEVVGGYQNGTAYWEHNGLVVTHGSSSAKNAAEVMLNQEGSVVFGHTHHEALFARTNRDGPHKAWGFGCLCNVSGPNTPPRSGHSTVVNWQQGFGIIRFGRRCYNVYPIGITNGGFVSPEGKEYVS